MNIEQIIQSYPAKSEYLVELLLDIDEQKQEHFVSEEEVKMIAD